MPLSKLCGLMLLLLPALCFAQNSLNPSSDLSIEGVFVDDSFTLQPNDDDFLSKPGSLESSQDFTLRPGDSVFLSLPGEASLNQNLQIRRDGKILLPEVGEISIKGLTLVEAAALIRDKLGEVIHDLARFELLLKDRRLMINVLGYVKQPGLVTLADGSTIQEAISAAQGLIPGAQLDKIQVRRKDQVLTLDYKQYLDSGEVSQLPQLQPLDTIFVPASPLIGNVQVEFDAATLIASGDASESDKAVTVFGEVIKPGTFSYKKDATVVDLIMRAGGLTRYAQVNKIRVISKGQPVMFDLKAYLDAPNPANLVPINPGDTIFVPEKTQLKRKSWLTTVPEKAVQVIGEVNRPGRYEWSDEMTLFDLIAHAGGPNHKGNIAQLKVLSKNDQGKVISHTFDMATFIEDGGNFNDIPTIKAKDVVVIPELPQDPSDNKAQWIRQSSKDSIYIMGEVVTPGRYMFNDSLHFLDILAAAEGPGDNADIYNIRISHRNGPDSNVSHFNLDAYFQSGDESLLPHVKAGDVIYVPAKNRLWLKQQKEHTVRVLGAIHNQGRYRYDQSMTILDLLAQAGGLTDSAYPSNIVVVNVSNTEGQISNFDLLEFSKTGDLALLPTLDTGDTVYVLNKQDSTWNRILNGVQDTLSLLSVFKILGGG